MLVEAGARERPGLFCLRELEVFRPMSDTNTTGLDELATGASSRIAASGRLADLEALKVELFGKKGAITAQLKSLGGLAPEARRDAGARINAVRDALTARVAERQ